MKISRCKFLPNILLPQRCKKSSMPLIKLNRLFSFLHSLSCFSPQEQSFYSSRWMHFAHSTSFQWKVLQFSSWLKKQTGFCCQRLEFFLCASPLRQQIKLSLIVLPFWARCIHTMLAKTLIIKSKYVETMENAFSYETFFPLCNESLFHTGLHCCSFKQIEIIFTKIIIQRESFVFTCGYFDINMKTLHSFVYTSITYLVILLQFNFEWVQQQLAVFNAVKSWI